MKSLTGLCCRCREDGNPDTLAAATILAHGTDMHKEKFLSCILTGEDTRRQPASEPGSGSDSLARRRARR